MIVFSSFYLFFWKLPNLKTCKIHRKLQCILKVGKNKKAWKLATKLLKNCFKKACSKTMEFWIDFYSKMVPGSLPGRSQSLPGSPQGAPRKSKGVSRQPLWLLFGSPRPPLWVSGCPLALPRCLQELFWEPGDPKCLVLDRFGSQISIKNWGFVSHVSNIYYPFLAWASFFNMYLVSWISLLLNLNFDLWASYRMSFFISWTLSLWVSKPPSGLGGWREALTINQSID